jgi:hypothetical protein
MLAIVGMILLLTWILDHALHLTTDSLINLLLLFATISFALDFIRERDFMNPPPGWDARPPKVRLTGVARRIRRLFYSSCPVVAAPVQKPAARSKGRA